MAYNNVKVKARQTIAQNQQIKGLGIVSEVPMGEWNVETPYKKLNLVRYNRATYIATQNNQGIAPQTSEVWQLLSEDGRDGDGREVTADRVILNSDITLAGNYVQVGNISKDSETATKIYPAEGKTVEQFLTEIFSKRLQPSITQMPAVSGFALSGVPSTVEAGTSYAQFTYGTAVLSAGSYTYGGATGVIAQSYSVDRICEPSSMSVTGVSTGASGTDNNGGNGFVIGDSGGANTVSSIKYRVNVTYNEGTIAKDNLGADSDPVVRIPAGTATQTTISVTPYRNFFYGSTTASNPPSGAGITSDFVRELTKSNRAYSSGTITVNVPAGSTGVYVACLATKTGVIKAINTSAMNSPVAFTKQQNIMVAGAGGYTSVAYNVWFYIPAVPFGNDNVLEITLG